MPALSAEGYSSGLVFSIPLAILMKGLRTSEASESHSNMVSLANKFGFLPPVLLHDADQVK